VDGGGEVIRRSRCVVGLIGGGIATSPTSLSPALHEAEADALGIAYAYQLIDIDQLGLKPDDVERLLGEARRMGFAGVNITHPCKQVVIEHLDELSDVAQALQAVNTVLFADGKKIGHNTDEHAFREGFLAGLPDVATTNVVLLGAGGAGAAVAHAALTLGTRELAIVDAAHERAQQLAARLSIQFPDRRVTAVAQSGLPGALAAADGLIHATPTGMAGLPGLPLPAELVQPQLWVADIVYRPLETELLQLARTRGCRTVDGGRMVVVQAADSFALFTGVQPDEARMLRNFEELLAAESELPLTSTASAR
jgi:shikimate dehydrogenase